KAYALFTDICARSAVSNEYYSGFDNFLELLNAKSSYVRIRGFALCWAQARWDERGKLQDAISTMLVLLHDDKPIVVRQCLAAFKGGCRYMKRIHLSDKVTAFLDDMNHPLRDEIEYLRKIIMSTGLELSEGIKWNGPN